MMSVSVLIALAGIGLGYFFYIKNPNMPMFLQFKFPKVHKALLNKWYVDEIYEFAIINATKQFALLMCWLDTNIIDGIVNGAATLTRAFSSVSISFDGTIVDGLVNGAATVVETGSRILRRIQTGYVQNYALAMVIGLFVLAAVVCCCMRRKYVYLGAPDGQRWRDLRIWSLLLVIPYILVYIIFGL